MDEPMKNRLEKKPVIMSAPCRLDFGGTLDISTFYFPLRKYSPSTFNLAINMRTRVLLHPYTAGRVKISSRGFETAEFDADNLPLTHPMGLMFAVAAYFAASGVHIDIQSSSPPRSALGGSSVAAVALIAAFFKLNGNYDEASPPLDEIVLLAHHLESSVARVPCGIQDQLAAAFGGVNQWFWNGRVTGLPYERKRLAEVESYPEIEQHFIAAYCGQPHESKDINGRWVDHFLTGKDIGIWKEIVKTCNMFSDAVEKSDYERAAELMRKETGLRLQMTPDVLDAVGLKLSALASRHDCGVRFTGAGGGGCVWAVGGKNKLLELKSRWHDELNLYKNAFLMDVAIDSDGVRPEPE